MVEVVGGGGGMEGTGTTSLTFSYRIRLRISQLVGTNAIGMLVVCIRN